MAALTSAISLLEALTQWLSGEKIKRTPSAIIMSLLVIVFAVAASFSYGDGILSEVKICGMQLFALFDKLTGTLLPPICALLTIIFFGWFMKKEDIMDELSNHGTLGIGYFKVFYYFLSRFVAPAALLIVLIAGIVG